eukprot:3244319-Amphidinium_carterae.1
MVHVSNRDTFSWDAIPWSCIISAISSFVGTPPPGSGVTSSCAKDRVKSWLLPIFNPEEGNQSAQQLYQILTTEKNCPTRRKTGEGQPVGALSEGANHVLGSEADLK